MSNNVTNPYAAPDTDLDPQPGEASWRYVVVSVALSIAWWLALLVPEASQSMLLTGTTLGVVWGFVRVVAIVSTGCLLFRRWRRAWSGLTWLTPLVCFWSGSALFALSSDAPDLPWSVSVAIVGPPVFAVLAWYVVIPMTTLTALVLVGLDPKPRRLP